MAQPSVTETDNARHLGSGIHLVDANYIKPGLAALYILVQQGQAAIIETGTVHSVPLILDTLEALGLAKEDVAYIMPTHVHLDHAGGAGALMEQCPNANLVIHPRGARHMIDPSKLIAGAVAVYGEHRFHELYGEIRPVQAERIIEAPDNFEVDFNGRVLRFLDTPGHARHHVCIYDRTSQGIFSGDTFGLCYRELDTPDGAFPLATTTPVQFDPDAMLVSIDRLMALEPESIYLTHFGRIRPTASYVNRLKGTITRFTTIAWREREPQQNRQWRIEQAMMDELLNSLSALQCETPRDVCEQILRYDVHLNAQGLDVWLSRLDAQAE